MPTKITPYKLRLQNCSITYIIYKYKSITILYPGLPIICNNVIVGPNSRFGHFHLVYILLAETRVYKANKTLYNY